MKHQLANKSALKDESKKTLPSASLQSKPPEQATMHPVLRLQRAIGNQAVQNMVQSGDMIMQTKLAVGQPGDVYEQEAERVAAQVVATKAPLVLQQKSLLGSSAVHDEECTECSRNRLAIQRRSIYNTEPAVAIPPVVHSVLQSHGQPLPSATRSLMESRFSQDFSQVRVHTDAQASESAQAIKALAYTVGRNIVFGDGEFEPGTNEGERLLAHELAHVVQQSHQATPKIQRQVTMPPDPGKMSDCKDLLNLIKEAVATLIQRAADLISDPLNLQWDNWTTPKILPDGTNVGSVQGHQTQYEGWRNRLRNLLDRWNDDDCNSTGLRVPIEVREWAFKPTPSPTPRPRPSTEPKPWEAPGTAPSTRRVAAAAKGAAIGATAGLILGGIIGAIGGGTGGTLVAPGVGTIGGGVGGAIAGAEAGAPIGAAIGTAIGGLIGWLSE